RVWCETPTKNGSWEWFKEVDVPLCTERAFAVQGETEADRVRLSVRADQHFQAPPPVVVERGTRDVRLRLQRGAPLRARVLAPPPYAQAATLRAVRCDGMDLPSYKPPWDYSGDLTRSLADATLVDFDGVSASFSWPALPAGHHRPEVRAPRAIKP